MSSDSQDYCIQVANCRVINTFRLICFYNKMWIYKHDTTVDSLRMTLAFETNQFFSFAKSLLQVVQYTVYTALFMLGLILILFINRLLNSLVVQCWLRVREVPGSIPSQGPCHSEDVIIMVPVVPLFRTEHSKGKIPQNRQMSNAKKNKIQPKNSTTAASVSGQIISCLSSDLQKLVKVDFCSKFSYSSVLNKKYYESNAPISIKEYRQLNSILQQSTQHGFNIFRAATANFILSRQSRGTASKRSR